MNNSLDIYRISVRFEDEKIRYSKNYYGLASDITLALTLGYNAAKKENMVDFEIDDVSKVGDISFDESGNFSEVKKCSR